MHFRTSLLRDRVEFISNARYGLYQNEVSTRWQIASESFVEYVHTVEMIVLSRATRNMLKKTDMRRSVTFVAD
jgi:hypothetical protein